MYCFGEDHKICYEPVVGKCNPQTIDTFDFSDAGNQEALIKFLSNPFFQWIRLKNVHLRNDGITKIDSNWKIFSKSLEVLDLRQNNINNLNVSAKYFMT